MANARKSTRPKRDDAISLLKADHRQVEEWFEQFEKARDDDRKQSLATRICNALKPDGRRLVKNVFLLSGTRFEIS